MHGTDQPNRELLQRIGQVQPYPDGPMQFLSSHSSTMPSIILGFTGGSDASAEWAAAHF